MARTNHITKEPVTLEGFQAVMAPSKFGYSLSAIVDQEMVDKLEEERNGFEGWWKSKLKNPKRSSLKPEPWEEVAEGKYKIKFSWNEETKPPVVDTEGTPVTDKRIPLYSGSTVKLAFYQKPYVLRDEVTYGSSLKIVGVQVVSINGTAGVDVGDLDATDVAGLFGTTKGFKADDPNVIPAETTDDDDF